MDPNSSLLGPAELIANLLGGAVLSVAADAVFRRLPLLLVKRRRRSRAPQVRARWLPPICRCPPHWVTAAMREEALRLRVEVINARLEPGVAAELYLVSRHGREWLEMTPRRVVTGSEILFDHNLGGVRSRVARGERFWVELRWNGRRVRAPVSASLIGRRKL